MQKQESADKPSRFVKKVELPNKWFVAESICVMSEEISFCKQIMPMYWAM